MQVYQLCITWIKVTIYRHINYLSYPYDKEAHPDPGNSPNHCLFVPALSGFRFSSGPTTPGLPVILEYIIPCSWLNSASGGPPLLLTPMLLCLQQVLPPSTGLLCPLPVPSQPWSHIGMDVVTGFPPLQGNDAILTIVDRFSKAMHFVPLSKRLTASETADLLVQRLQPQNWKNYFCRKLWWILWL